MDAPEGKSVLQEFRDSLAIAKAAVAEAKSDFDSPRFRLTDVTQAAGEALKLLTPAERLASDRSVAVVLQGMIDRLKALDTPKATVGDRVDFVEQQFGWSQPDD